MPLLSQKGGCKVGWEYWATLDEAKAASERELLAAERKRAQGYDFGYCWPGEVRHVESHPEHGECWVVTTT